MEDVRLAFRALRATPIVSLAAVASLALGMGANTALFSLVNSLLLRSLPVDRPEHLALVTDTGRGGASLWTNAIWEQVRDRPQLFDGALAYSPSRFSVAIDGEPETVDGMWASGGYFDTLGVHAIAGRLLSVEDDRRGAPGGAILVISHDFWQRRFSGAADVVGRTVTIESVPFTIAGIAPPGFHGVEVGRRFDVALPLGAEPLLRRTDSFLDRRDWSWLTVMIRLKPGQRLEGGASALRAVQPQIRDAAVTPGPRALLQEPFSLEDASAGTSPLRRRYGRPLVTITVVAGVVLLVACTNIANLLLARTIARRHERSVKAALGASRWRLARELFAESALLAAAGTLLGWLFANWASHLLVRQLSTQFSVVFLDLSPDWRVFAFSAAIAIFTAVLFGTAPAFLTSRARPILALKDGGRGTVGSQRIGLADGLVITQIALSVVLTVAAGLLGRTFVQLATMDVGFDKEGVVLATLDMQSAGIQASDRERLLGRVRESVGGVPGVSSVGLSPFAPLVGGYATMNVVLDGVKPLPDAQQRTTANYISPGWFSAYRMAILAGRDVTDADRAGAPAVAIVNRAFARKFAGGGNPVGRAIMWGSRRIEIVGLVADAVYRSAREPMSPTVYIPLAQNPGAMGLPSAILSVRAQADDPRTLVRDISRAVAGVNPQVRVTFRPLADYVNGALAQERLLAVLSGFFGALALLLAGLGLYGVTAFSVHRRTSELGLRLTLGATPWGVVRLVIRRVMLLVVSGVAIGTIASVWLSRFVATLLYGLEPRDPLTLAGAALLLIAVGAAAGWLPARRAALLDPAQTLRNA